MKKQRFDNYDQYNKDTTILDLINWHRERRSKTKDLTQSIPHAKHKAISDVQLNRQELSITWIGHSTFLIQWKGLNILTDPVWAKRMGLQKRLTEPGMAVEQMPEIDVVLISHGHYDHLDFFTLRKLKGDPIYYIPVGLKRAFAKRGYRRVTEANWWDGFTFQDSGLSFHFVPAQHWSRRTPWDTNISHWGGWVIEEEESGETIYFVGDSGYFRGFKEIGERFSIGTVLMPIGAYEPEWFMHHSHINPEDAIQAFLDLNAQEIVPMHYGAFRLADDTGPEALGRFLKEWDRLQLPVEKLRVLALGETVWPDREKQMNTMVEKESVPKS
ncbi:MBL fold metallo-hydrolase [Salsuginibacillus kocurii]|uniref:MBL fold metallo-hydrolase n=1 Tax=Salsuginibacillus kocurii TaxID=427078 RepID=UPI00036C71D8|nr:MBL fold metallo-hydrolase [Salsuginibacillus kocurii]